MVDQSDYDEAFAPIVLQYVRQMAKSEHPNLSRSLREGLLVALRKWTDRPVEMISKRVADLGNAKGNDPFQLQWPKRNEFGQNEAGKSILVWEHTTPLSEAIEGLVTCDSIESIRTWMRAYSGVCWVTREEDNYLSSKGFSKRRPGGWEKCYEECGIHILRREPE